MGSLASDIEGSGIEQWHGGGLSTLVKKKH